MRLLLAASVAVGALVLPVAVRAQELVMDPITEANEVKNTLHDIADYDVQTKDLTNLIKTLQLAIQAYNAVNSITNVNSVSSALMLLQTRMPLPQDVNSVVQLLQGLGAGGTLAGIVQSLLASQQVYHVPGNDFQATRINNNATATAGQFAVAQQVYQASTARLTGADDLQARMGTALTSAEKTDLISRVGIETLRAQAQTNQLLATQIMQSAQSRLDDERLEQQRRQSVDNLVLVATEIIATGGALPAGMAWAF